MKYYDKLKVNFNRQIKSWQHLLEKIKNSTIRTDGLLNLQIFTFDL